MNNHRPLPLDLEQTPQDSAAPPARRHLQRRAPAPLALEQRVMFDGAAVDAVVRAAAGAAPAAAADGADAAEGERVLSPVALAPAARTVHEEARREVVFIEDNLPDYLKLAAGAGAGEGREVIVLDHTRDGLQQMIAALQGREVDAIHLVTHGANGQIDLGSSRLSVSNVDAAAGQLAQLGQSLSADGDLLLYGCDVAGGAGEQFIARLAELTGADVAASVDTTGSSGFGNWTLEAQAGSIETAAQALDDAGWQGGMLTTVFDAQQRQLVFSGAVAEKSGSTGTASGDVMRFKNVIQVDGQWIDAIVTTTTDRLSIGTYDSTTQPSNAPEAAAYFQPITTVTSAGGSATFKFDFVLSGSTTAVTLQNFVINSYDIDSSGNSKVDRQFQEFKGFSRYELSKATQLTPTVRADGSVTFEYNAAVSTNFTGNLYDDVYRVQVYYDSASSIQIRTGANGYNGGAFSNAAAHFSLEFQIRPWKDATDIVGTPAANLRYGDTVFEESAANDGSIAGTSTIVLANGSFSGADGQALAGVSFANLPAGLSATVVRINATTAELRFSGAATAHAEANGIKNFGVSFGNAAFASGNAGAVTGASRSDLVIDFDDDTTAPVMTEGQRFDYAENRVTDAIIGKVVAADNIGVTGFRFADTQTDRSFDNRFRIAADGTIRMTATGVASASNDFEAAPNGTYSVQARDLAGNWSIARDVTLNITNLDDTAPVFGSPTVASAPENQDLLYTAQAADSIEATDGAVTYALGAGLDRAQLRIDSITGAVTLASGNLDFEAKSRYSFIVQATDASGNTRQQTVTVNVANADEVAPVFTSGAHATVNENQDLLYTAQASDSVDFTDGAVSYALQAGGDAGLLSIDSATGAVRLASGNLDFETKSQYSFTVIAQDASGNVRQQAVTVDVANLDEVAPAFTSGAHATVNENQDLLYTAQANDSVDFTDGAVSYALQAGGDAALLQIDSSTGAVRLASGNLDFETKSQYSFTVLARDASGNVRQQAVTVDVANIDEVAPAITSGASATVNENQNLLYTAQATDSVDFTNGAVSYALQAGGDAGLLSIDSATGAVRLASGNLDFETKSQYSFTVIAQDASGNVRQQAVTVDVANIDEVAPAFASGASVTVNENQDLLYTAQANDSVDFTDGAVSYALAAGGDAGLLSIDSATGAVRLANGDLDFETKSQYSFTVVAQDASGNVRQQAVTVDVANIDEVAPAFTSTVSTTVNENQDLLYTAQATDNVDFTDGAVSYALQAGGDAGLLSIDSSTGAVRLASGNLDFETKSQYSFTVLALDASGNARQQSVTVDVANIDEVAPVFASQAGASANENQNLLYTAQAADSADFTDGAVSYALQAGGDAGLLTIDSSTGAVRLASGNLDVEAKSQYVFTVVAQDASGNARQQAVTVDVVDLNEAPTAAGDSVSTAEDTPFVGQLPGYADPDGDSASYYRVAQPLNGEVTIATDGSYTYTPRPSFFGSDSFSYSIEDGRGGYNIYRVDITVTPVNDAPVAGPDSIRTAEDSAVSGRLPLAVDAEGDPVTYTVATGPSKGELVLDADGRYTYTPYPNANGADSFVYRVGDGKDSTLHTVTIAIDAVNDAPVAAGDSVVTAEDTAYAGRLPAASDLDGDAVGYALASGPSHGQVSIDSDGRYVYTPAADFNGSDSFSYRVSDGQGGSNVYTVGVTVTPVNDAPTAANTSIVTFEDEAHTGSLPAARDVDGNPVGYALLEGPAHGSVSIGPDGRYTYTPAADYNGADRFRYTVDDGQGGSNSYTVEIAVTAVNDAPVASPGLAGEATLGEPMAPLSLAPFTDIDSPALRYTAALAGGGELPSWLHFDPATLGFTGTPPGGALGRLDIVVSGSDGALAASANVTIVVGNPAAPTQRASIELMTRDTGSSVNDFVTADGAAGRSVSGTLDAPLGRNEALQVSFDGGASWTTASVEGGSWRAVDNGAHGADWTIVTRVTNTVAGLSGPETSRDVTLDREAPAAPTADDVSTGSTTPVLTGSAVVGAGETLQVAVNGRTYTVPVQDGRWSLDLAGASPSAALVEGRSYEVVATVFDVAGNSRSSDTVGTVRISAPVPPQAPVAPPVVAAPAPEPVPLAPTPVAEPAPPPAVRDSVVPGSVVGGDTVLLSTGIGTRAELEFANVLRGAELSDVYTRSEGFRTVVAKAEEPALVLFQGVPDQFVDAGAQLSMTVPADAFAHTQPKATVRLAAVLQDGRPLPTWVQFNGQTGQFTGDVPKGLTGELKIKLIARDLNGREAVALFRLNVGQVRTGEAAAAGKAGLTERLGQAGQGGKAASLRGRP